MVYNTRNGGYLGQALKRLIIARAELKKSTDIHVPIEFSAAEKGNLEAAMDYLKSAVVNSDNLDRIKEKMVERMSYRTELMNDQNSDLKESFPFLFASVELVSHEFTVNTNIAKL